MAGQLELTVRFWESRLQDKSLLSISTANLIELTIKYLEVLKETGYTDPNDK